MIHELINFYQKRVQKGDKLIDNVSKLSNFSISIRGDI